MFVDAETIEEVCFLIEQIVQSQVYVYAYRYNPWAVRTGNQKIDPIWEKAFREKEWECKSKGIVLSHAPLKKVSGHRLLELHREFRSAVIESQRILENSNGKSQTEAETA